MPNFKIPEMAQSEFAMWQSMLESRSGLWLPDTRKAFLVTNLHRHMRKKGVPTFDDFYQLLNRTEVSSLDWAELVDSLTVHETCFYRDKDSLNLVISYCRNKALSGWDEQPDKHQNVHLWSVGCSTGEETYTLALEMEKLNLSLNNSAKKTLYYGVTGIDVSYPSLAVAREGIYSGKSLDFLPTTSQNSYFERLENNQIQVSKSIRKRTCFMQANILELDSQPNQTFDVIYCQNVLIYFKQERKEEIISDFEKRLKPGGILVLGHGEVTSLVNSNLTRVDNKHCLAFIKSEHNITNQSELA
jgi:chemotaxis protein methyltransferase CheR/type IV pilus assembly protein PilK